LGFGDYQIRDLQTMQRHVTLVLLSYFVLILVADIKLFPEAMLFYIGKNGLSRKVEPKKVTLQ